MMGRTAWVLRLCNAGTLEKRPTSQEKGNTPTVMIIYNNFALLFLALNKGPGEPDLTDAQVFPSMSSRRESELLHCNL
jgi:hypothetical protein